MNNVLAAVLCCGLAFGVAYAVLNPQLVTRLTGGVVPTPAGTAAEKAPGKTTGAGDRPFGSATEEYPAEKVFALRDLVHGQRQADWVEEFHRWQIAHAFPRGVNRDLTGAKLDLGQSGPVFFLPTGYNPKKPDVWGKVERDCPVPANKTLLLPVSPTILSYGVARGQWTAQGTHDFLERVGRGPLDRFQARQAEVEVLVDGRALKSPESYRVRTGAFEAPVPPEMVRGEYSDHVGADAGKSFELPQAGARVFMMADGVYVFLKPLSPGPHEVVFRSFRQNSRRYVNATFRVQVADSDVPDKALSAK
jgi:hypothetical protein